jgi:hypothetical protein
MDAEEPYEADRFGRLAGFVEDAVGPQLAGQGRIGSKAERMPVQLTCADSGWR